jgi:hypothetical protein
MDTIIGLFPYSQNFNHQMKYLNSAGFDKKFVKIIYKEIEVQKLLGVDRNQNMTKYSILGAVSGILIYGSFTFAAGWCDCVYFNFSISTLFIILLFGVMVGLLIGGIIGAIIGMGEFEEKTHLYTRGLTLGDQLIALQIEKNKKSYAMTTLRNLGCLGVRAIS